LRSWSWSGGAGVWQLLLELKPEWDFLGLAPAANPYLQFYCFVSDTGLNLANIHHFIKAGGFMEERYECGRYT